MSSTLLEQTRATHEEIERLQRGMIEEMKRVTKTHKDNVAQSHRINNTLDHIVTASRRLEQTYEDKDGSRKEEVASIGGQGPSLYSLFYDRLREIKDYHRRYPNVQVERPENLHLHESEVAFTGEEGHGKYLDLHALYGKFINLDDATRMDYLTYLQSFYKFDQLPESRLYNRKHKEYVSELLEYLISFLRRAQPLLVVETELQPHEKEFEDKWNSGAFNATTTSKPAADTTSKSNTSASTTNNNTSAVNNNTTSVNNNNKTSTASSNNNTTASSTSTPSTAAAADNDAEKKKKNKKRKPKKTADAAASAAPTVAPTVDDFNNPLYCRACGKLYAKDTVFNAHLKSKKHLDLEKSTEQSRKETLVKEMKVQKLGELLSEQISSTKANVEKKQSLSNDERMRDLEEEEDAERGAEEEEDEDEEEPVRMTIENYPIGWDGKPIPYWLYKLHGLGIEYKCEICGNTSYFGRKAFEKHFQEWRHAHGMSCLGIPNTLHFQEITKIQDAQALWVKIKTDGQKVIWRPDAEEEYEDRDGHVMSRRTYEDLKRQGILTE